MLQTAGAVVDALIFIMLEKLAKCGGQNKDGSDIHFVMWWGLSMLVCFFQYTFSLSDV